MKSIYPENSVSKNKSRKNVKFIYCRVSLIYAVSLVTSDSKKTKKYTKTRHDSFEFIAKEKPASADQSY